MHIREDASFSAGMDRAGFRVEGTARVPSTELAHRAQARRHGSCDAKDDANGACLPWADTYSDDHFISIHHQLKWYKFGITRMFDNLSLEIRTGQLPRVEAKNISLLDWRWG